MGYPRELARHFPTLLVLGPVRMDVQIDNEFEDCCSPYCEHLSAKYDDHGRQVQEIRRNCDDLGRLRTVWRCSGWDGARVRYVLRHPQCRAGIPTVRRQRCDS